MKLEVGVLLPVKNGIGSILWLNKLVGGRMDMKENEKLSVTKEDKKFSLKRGVTFFGKSNLVLLIALLFFFINKSSWSEQGGSVVFLFTLSWEIVILICSFFACFKKKGDNPLIKRVKST